MILFPVIFTAMYAFENTVTRWGWHLNNKIRVLPGLGADSNYASEWGTMHYQSTFHAFVFYIQIIANVQRES